MPSTSLYASPFVAGSTNASPCSLDSKDPQTMRRASSSSSKFSSEDEDDDDDENVPLIVLKTRYLLSGRTTKVGQGLGISMVPGLEQDRQERGFVSASTAKPPAQEEHSPPQGQQDQVRPSRSGNDEDHRELLRLSSSEASQADGILGDSQVGFGGSWRLAWG
ncbi:hypothetical protein AB1N83_007734 [Pleurotus pulmonarius]